MRVAHRSIEWREACDNPLGVAHMIADGDLVVTSASRINDFHECRKLVELDMKVNAIRQDATGLRLRAGRIAALAGKANGICIKLSKLIASKELADFCNEQDGTELLAFLLGPR